MAALGDIALVGYAADTAGKSFSFVLLADLSGQTINFTDNGWLAAGSFRSGEGTVSYTVPASTPIGTVITISGLTGTFNPSTSGDQILAYVGSAASPTFLFALDFADGNASFAGDATNSNTSAVPTGLTFGTNALAFGTDNGAYTGPLSGTRAEILANIANAANWTLDDVTPVTYASGFTVTGGSAASVTINDVMITEGDMGTTIATFTVTRSDNSGSFTLDYTTADGTATAGSDYVGAAGSISFTAGGALTQTISVTINGDTLTEGNETFTVGLSNLVSTVGTAAISDASGLGTIVNDDFTLVAIHDIQGASHLSPFAGQTVSTAGIVTAVATNGFYLQAADANIDADNRTSEAIFVFTSTAPTVAVGDAANVTGTVTEFVPGGAASGNLSTTEIVSPVVSVTSSNNALPTAILLGAGGRMAPTEVIDSDNFANFNPDVDGIDFYESLEGMLVTVPSPLVVAPTTAFGEVFTVADSGANATGLSARGTIVTSGSIGDGLLVTNTGPGADFNPERIQIDAGSFTPGSIPIVNAGTVLNDVTGVLSYNFGNFEVQPTAAVTVKTPSILTGEITNLKASADTLTIASFNTLNLDLGDAPAGHFTSLALQIVNNLGAPDIIGLQEIQDNSGPTNDGTIAANLTLQALVDAIAAAGGPTYTFIDNPFITNNTNGGEPGGNIRVAYLYDASRVSLVAGSLTTTPNAAADFAGSRPPLSATFEFNGEQITLVNNHFSSKGGSSYLFGSDQPSVNGGAAARLVQAQNVADYVASLGAGAKVVVLGDLNEFTNEESLAPLGAAGLNALSLTLDPTERYSYSFEGNAQELDQIYVSGNLLADTALDIVHTNSEFVLTAASASDHDPSVIALRITPTVIETQSIGFENAALAIAEGNGGTAAFTFTVVRTGGTTGQLDFSGSFASGTADAADFGGLLPTAFSGSFADGAATATVSIAVNGDAIIEANETFSLTLTAGSNSGGATVVVGSGATATGTIVNDDLIDLSTYVRVGRYDLPEPTRTMAPPNSVLAQEASAVTYNWDTDTLFVVGDGGTSIVQVTKTGELINSMTLATGSSPQGTEFYDPEGLAYIGNGQFVFTEERDRNAVKFTYAADTVLTRADAQTVHLGTNVGNIGLEGVTYDPLTSGFIFVKEKSPEGVFQTTIDFATDTASNGSATTVNSINLFDPSLTGLIDFADVFALSNIVALQGTVQEGHILILSQESGKIIEVDRAGIIYSTLTIVSDPGNPLDVVAQQHEGVAVGPDGTIYVVSENGGGDFDHPQLWVYRPSATGNAAPTAINLTDVTTDILENTSTATRIKVADVVVTDDGIGTNILSVTGADAAFFEVDSTGLYVKAGTVLDYETKTSYSVTVSVDDPAVGASPDASTDYTLNVTDIVDETALPNVYVSEVAPWSSGNSPVGADWFEVTNGSSAPLNITGWRFDDNSGAFGNSVALAGVTSIAAGESVIFIEAAPADAAARITSFVNTWFGGTAPAGLQFGTYSGSGVGLSTGGDAVNLFDSTGVLQANVSFGPSPNGPFPTFNNAAGLNNAAISTLSSVGTNGAFAAAADAAEIGSPGSVGRLIISEVAPWSSGNSPVGADWFEVTNTTVAAINITGWKFDDSSGSPAAAVALAGITSIAPGESVIFIESSNPAAARAAFIDTWFGGNAPANLQIGTYSGSGVGLSTGGDAVNLYDATNALRASVTFGPSPNGPFASFDNARGLNNATISQLSVVGTNAAHLAANDIAEIGSPGEIVAVNDAPIGVDDSVAGLVEDGLSLVTGNVLANDTDVDLVQTSTEILAVSGARAGSEAAGGLLAAVAGATLVDGVYGVLTINTDGSYSYALDNSRAATQALNAGETVIDSFTYRVSDAQGLADTAQLDVAIAGSDEGPAPITGTEGDDVLNGTEFADVIFGLGGNDSIFGLGGDDVISGGPGNDRLDGGEGVDTASYADAGSGVTVNLNIYPQDTLGAGIDTLRNIENLTGSDFDDVLRGNTGANRLEGGSGNDALFGGRGDDILIGGAGNDFLEGGTGADIFVFDTVHDGDIDVISDFGVTAGDMLQFGPGITVTNVSISRMATGAFFNGQNTANGAGFDLTVTLSSADGTQTLHILDTYGYATNNFWESQLGIDLTYPQPLPLGNDMVPIA